MNNFAFAGLLALVAGSFVTTPSSAQSETATPMPGTSVAVSAPVASCLDHIRSFNTKLEHDGHWVGGSNYGVGYPASAYWLGGAGFFPPMNGYVAGVRVSARAGYEVRTLLASAAILGRHGKQQPCEDSLTAAGEVYKTYESDLKSLNIPATGTVSWRDQIAAAKPVSEQTVPMRSEDLLGTELRNGANEPLGSVDDLILDPATGRIAYVVIARGGLFGIGAEFVPVPWSHFKMTPKLDLLVIDASRRTMEEAPHLDVKLFGPEDTTAQDQKADLYWKTHLSQN